MTTHVCCMATETELTEVNTQSSTGTKELTVAQRDNLFKPGNQAALGHSPKLSQMAIWRRELEQIDPGTGRTRIEEIFRQMYEIATGTLTWHDGHERKPKPLSGKDMVAAAEFITENSYGKAPAQSDPSGAAVQIVQIAIPAGSQTLIGIKSPEPALIAPEFPPEE